MACRYEVTLGTCGIQQVGWATMRCRFTDQKGAGDTMNSYAFDGKRKRKWNGTEQEYGLHWSGGDVVGVRIDLDAREARPHTPLPEQIEALCCCGARGL